ncbi:hypothetical protein HY227_00640 [Candidatus Wolfebacteria bacterium]|nr:hypothetical protein [Candidatus Wolfebacteria bacterium]
MKRPIIIIIIILAIAALLLGIYFAWKKSRAIMVPASQNSGQSGGLPDINNPENQNQASINVPQNQDLTAGQEERKEAPEKLKIISGGTASGYLITPSGIGATTTAFDVFYMNEAGQIIKIGANNEEIISEKTFDDIQLVKTSRNGKFILIKYGSINNPDFSIFNIETKVWQKLSNVSAADFSPDSKKIAYLENSNNSAKSNLALKDLTGANPKSQRVLSLYQKDFDLIWNNPEKIFLEPKPSSEYEGQIWAVGVKNKTMSQISSGLGLMAKWSSDGKAGIRFKTSPDRSQKLDFINDKGEVLGNLDFFTLPNKCAINQSVIYCALPQSYNSMIEPTLPDDYLKKAVYSRDFIFRIDTNQNSFDLVLGDLGRNIDAVNLNFYGNQLFFINRYDGRLYSLETQ